MATCNGLTLFFLVLAGGVAKATAFACGGAGACQAMAGYVPSNETTYKAVKELFQLDSILALYGANGLPPTTLPSAKLRGGAAVRVPFPCACKGGVGVSDRRPVYTVAENDTLFLIATVKFGHLTTYEQIQTVNGIKNADLIEIGQKLWIPIPCSCDPAKETVPAVHLAHVAAPGSVVAAIAAEFGATEKDLLRVNNMSDPKSLQAYQVLDVPLRACDSSIRGNAEDGSLRVANGSYAFTASDCVECGCSASSWQLACKMSNLSSTNSSACRAPTCDVGMASRPLQLGEQVTVGCNSTRCHYAGYYKSSGLNITAVAVTNQSTCSAPSSSSASDLRPLLSILFAASLLFLSL
ncbi:lysm domain GPI-anchored protein 2 precursor isoform X2 [Wolffia australiana]